MFQAGSNNTPRSYSITAIRDKANKTKQQFLWYSKFLSCNTRNINFLGELPLLTSEILEEHYYNSRDFETFCEVYKTSGTSSGKRKNIFYSKEDDDNYLRIRKDVYRKFLSDDCLKRVFSDMGTGHAANTAKKVFESFGFIFDYVSYDTPISIQIERMKEFKPDVLYTMPSLLDNIIRNSDDILQFQIKKIILVGEVATPQWIRRVADVFQICCSDILDTYGSIEIGTIATFNHKHNCYVIQKDLLAEGINAKELSDEYSELPSEQSVLVLTSFVRNTFPALRFVTYDVVKNLRTETIDHEERQVFDCIIKRIGHEIKHGEKISIYDIENVIFKYISTAEVRVNVVDNQVVVDICSPELNDQLLNTISTAVQDAVPEIGDMVACGKLAPILVRSISTYELKFGGIKNKKVYTNDQLLKKPYNIA